MATTAKGTPYVESTDLVANYPAASLALANHIDDFGGKVLQVVRATDTTDRTTTSDSYVDASLSVTITPQKTDSAVVLIWASRVGTSNNTVGSLRITDSSDNAINGAEQVSFYPGVAITAVYRNGAVLVGYTTPASTSALTYKARFKSSVAGLSIGVSNSEATGQLYAIEVSA
jgi:hypothetical protein